MTTELEKQFFKVFEIEPTVYSLWDSKETQIKNFKSFTVYPEITDRKLLQLLCIYNDMHWQIEFCLIPCKYEDTKEMILQTLVDEKTRITDYEEGTYMDTMTKEIQQLFKEEE